jgi:hypothetical protein
MAYSPKSAPHHGQYLKPKSWMVSLHTEQRVTISLAQNGQYTNVPHWVLTSEGKASHWSEHISSWQTFSLRALSDTLNPLFQA